MQLALTEHDTNKAEQNRGQILLFQQVLAEFGATTPEQAVQLWGKGIQYRNGVYHYFVAAENLREKLITAWGLPEESYWNIGTSSPWLDGFEIIERKIVSAKKQKVKIKYYWLTSTGPAGATMETLTLVKDGAFWQVTEIN